MKNTKRTRTDGWKSTPYPEKTVKIWCSKYWSAHPRASDLLLDFCGKTVRDTWKLAQWSQIGWNLWKKAVDAIDMALRAKSSPALKNPELFFKNSFDTTIQELSSLVADKLFCELEDYPHEFEFLTRWYSRIIKVEQAL